MSESHTDADDEPLVTVRDLQKYYFERDTLFDRLLGRESDAVRAVDGVSFDVYEGETLGLVGESGCGKSTTAETLLRLRTPTGGTAHFDGEDIYDGEDDVLTEFRRRTGIVFQDPFSSLDPRQTAGEIIREPLVVHDVASPSERKERAGELMERVGLSSDQLDRYPHEFSGGQRQRIGIARALALDPDFVVCDEPVSALDVSVQAQILNLLDDLQEEFGLTYLFIAHDLSVVRHICDRVAVMYLGEVVEVGRTDELFENPRHPYTQALLESVPRANTEEQERAVEALAGDVPSPRDPPSGCRFRTRCPEVIPPDDLDIRQETYREVMNLRDWLERDEADLDVIRREIDTERGENAFVAHVRSEFFDHNLSGENETVVEESLEALAEEDRTRAISMLRDRFESVCESVRPGLQDTAHPAACHLYEQPSTQLDAEDELTPVE
jgi:peptide/nickel transport system ATP-binding protein